MAKVLTLTCTHTDTLYVPEYICASRHIRSYSGPSRSVYNLVCTELICTDSHHKPGKFVLFTLSQICSKAFQRNLSYISFSKSQLVTIDLKDLKDDKQPDLKFVFWVYCHFILLSDEPGWTLQCSLQGQYFASFLSNLKTLTCNWIARCYCSRIKHNYFLFKTLHHRFCFLPWWEFEFVQVLDRYLSDLGTVGWKGFALLWFGLQPPLT